MVRVIKNQVCRIAVNAGRPSSSGDILSVRPSNRVSPEGARLSITGNLGRLFLSVAKKLGPAPLIVTPAGVFSYDWCRRAAIEIAQTLRSHPDFCSGSRVLLSLANSPEYIACFYGTLLANGVVVPLPPTVEEERFDEIVDQTAPTHLLIHAHTARDANPNRRHVLGRAFDCEPDV